MINKFFFFLAVGCHVLSAYASSPFKNFSIRSAEYPPAFQKIADATFLIAADTGKGSVTCAAVRIGTGRFLTALHCLVDLLPLNFSKRTRSIKLNDNDAVVEWWERKSLKMQSETLKILITKADGMDPFSEYANINPIASGKALYLSDDLPVIPEVSDGIPSNEDYLVFDINLSNKMPISLLPVLFSNAVSFSKDTNIVNGKNVFSLGFPILDSKLTDFDYSSVKISNGAISECTSKRVGLESNDTFWEAYRNFFIGDRLFETTLPSDDGSSGGPVFDGDGNFLGILVSGTISTQGLQFSQILRADYIFNGLQVELKDEKLHLH